MKFVVSRSVKISDEYRFEIDIVLQNGNIRVDHSDSCSTINKNGSFKFGDHMMNLLAIIFGMPGGWELLIVVFIVLLLFGKRLPDTMRSLGRSITEFKKGASDTDDNEQKDQ